MSRAPNRRDDELRCRGGSSQQPVEYTNVKKNNVKKTNHHLHPLSRGYLINYFTHCHGLPFAPVVMFYRQREEVVITTIVIAITIFITIFIANTSPELEAGGKIRTRYFMSHCKGIETLATVPDNDSTCTKKRSARLFCEDRQQLWLAVGDAEWAMKYVQHHLGCKGLDVADNDPGPGWPLPPQLHPPQPLLELTDVGMG